MTDRPDTNQDLVATLATITESFSTAVTPSLDEIESQLLPLLQDAQDRNDPQAMTLIEGTYLRAQELVTAERHSREAALTAIDIAGTMKNQRDNIAKEYEELSEAVDYMDTDHPKVADLVESIQEAINEDMNVYWDDSLFEDMYQHLQDAFGYDTETINRLSIFMEVICANIEVQPNRKREFFAWIDAVKADDEAGNDDE